MGFEGGFVSANEQLRWIRKLVLLESIFLTWRARVLGHDVLSNVLQGVSADQLVLGVE